MLKLHRTPSIKHSEKRLEQAYLTLARCKDPNLESVLEDLGQLITEVHKRGCQPVRGEPKQ
jgi:hypothetical protein